MKARPVLFVLAGVDGAGKSSIGGYLLERAGATWFNPDAFATDLMAVTGCSREDANGVAWAEGLRRLDETVANRRSYAFETTLGGTTEPRRILDATRTHEVLMWFCGLDSPQRHVERVHARVAAGGHDIPESRIRERYPRAIRNLVALLPHLAHLQVYDNSTEARKGQAISDPVLVLEMHERRVLRPVRTDRSALAATPIWARPIVEAALSGAA